MLKAATRGRPVPALSVVGSLVLPLVQCLRMKEKGLWELQTQWGAGKGLTTGFLVGLAPTL